MKLDADGRENGLYGNYLRQGKEREEKKMKAISKRVLSFALALVMVLTLAVVPSEEAQAATGLAKSKTYYAGQTTTLKLTTSSDWKKVKTTWKSSKPSVVKISKSATKSASIKCVKAGTAKVTAKVSYKKGRKTSSKTFTCKVTVKDATFDVSIDATTLTVGETTRINVVKTPESAVVKYSSDDAAIAKIAGGKIYANAVGTTNINARLKVGSFSIRKSIPVTVVPAVDGVSVKLANPLTEDYTSTVLVNQNAILNVSCVKDGKPVVGETVIMNKNTAPGNTNKGTDYVDENGVKRNSIDNYEVKGSNANTAVATTNSKGIATFIIGNKLSGIKATDVNQFANVNYTVSVSGMDQTVDVNVGFAAVESSSVTVKNGAKDLNGKYIYSPLEPGTNYTSAKCTNGGIAKTASMDAPTDFSDEYVESQQVSSQGKDEHAVYVAGGYPSLKIPNTASTVISDAEKKVDTYTDKKYGPYETYADDSVYIELTEDPEKLTYATVKFDYLKLSKYTHAEITTYESKEKAEKNIDGFGTEKFEGAQNQGAFNYQVPLNYGKAKVVKVTVKSAGQVDTALNEGFNVSAVEYVFKKNVSNGYTTTPIKGGEVSWSIVDTEYTAELPLALDTWPAVFEKKAGERLTYKVPRFPYTGTAVITKYDSNGKVVAYYAGTTRNNTANQNVLSNVSFYKITEDELRTKVGTIESQDGQIAKVNSYQSGRTTLEGKVTVNGKVLEDLDAETNTVYTSIQWNPIPNKDGAAATDTNGYVAFVGQNITVTAQLIDKNGNAVTDSAQDIEFSYDETAISKNATVITPANVKPVTVVKAEDKTDSKGQAKLVLRASDITGVANVSAKAKDKKYNVRLIVGTVETELNADLYWVEAELKFAPDCETPANANTMTSPTNTNVTVDLKADNKTPYIAPLSGSTWLYGVQTSTSALADIGKYKGKTVTVTGLDVTMAKAASGVGAVDKTTKFGQVKATSTKTGKMTIVSKINASSVTASTAVTAEGVTFVGEGKPSIDRTLKLVVNWMNNGMVAEVLAPNGNIFTTDTTDVYVSVTDTNGNAVSGNKVTFKKDAGTLSADSAVTDKDGIAKVTLSGLANNDRATVTATVDGISGETYSMTYIKKAPGTFGIDKNADDITEKYKSVFDKDAKTITLVFNDDIVASSVNVNAIKANYVELDADGVTPKKTIDMGVDTVSVADNTVTIKVINVPGTISVTDNIDVVFGTAPDKGIDYTMTSVNGVQYTGKTVTIKPNAGKTAPDEK